MKVGRGVKAKTYTYKKKKTKKNLNYQILFFLIKSEWVMSTLTKKNQNRIVYSKGIASLVEICVWREPLYIRHDK